MTSLTSRSPEELRKILDAHPAGIVEVGVDGSIRLANTEACRFLGFAFDAVTNRYVVNWQGETLRDDGSLCPVEEYPVSICLMTGQPTTTKTIGVRRPNGEVYWATFRAVPIRDAQDNLEAAVVMFTDITERIETEQKLRTSEGRLRHTMEHLPAVLWTTDRDMIVQTASGKALANLNLTASGIAGQHVEVITRGDPNAAGILKDHQRALAGEYVARTSSFRDRHFQTVIEPLQDKNGIISGCIGLSFDITELMGAQGRLNNLLQQEASARRQAEQAVHARDVFLSVAAHELRTPLAVLILHVEGLLKHLGQTTCATECPAHMASMLDTVTRQTRRISTHVDRLLDVTRVTAGKLVMTMKEGVDLSRIALEIADDLMRTKGDAATELLCDAPSPVTGCWDEFRLNQVVTNLLTNAIKFGRQKPVRIRVSAANGQGILEVSDEGVGIAKVDQASIFEKFDRGSSSRSFGGFGLGLFIAREIVLAHGGAISLDSTPGVGSRFTVYLPLEPPSHHEADWITP